MDLQVILAIGGVLLGAGVLVAGLIGMAVWLGRRSAQGEAEVNAAWAALAQSLGLNVTGGRPPVLTGMHRGRPLRIQGGYGNRNNPGYTRVAYAVNYRADVYLRVVQRRNLGAEYVQSGAPELDRRFAFQSRPPELIARVAADPALRGLLGRADSGLTLTPTEVSAHTAGVVHDPDRLKLMVDLAGEMAGFVERQIGAAIPETAPKPAQFYDDVQSAPTIRIPRQVWPFVIVVGLIVTGACLCLALWPALSMIWTQID